MNLVTNNTAVESHANEASQQHLNIILTHAPKDSFVELRAFADRQRGVSGGSHWISTTNPSENDIQDAISWAEKQRAKGMGVFVGYNARTIKVGNKESVRQVTAAYVDLDLEKRNVSRETAMKQIEYAPVQPDLIVNSGRGLHLIWFFQPTNDIQAWEKLQTRLGEYFSKVGADGSLRTDTARVLRLTPFPNQKEGGIRETKIVRFTDFQMRTLQGISTAFGVSEKEKTSLVAQSKNGLPKEIKEGGTVEYNGRNDLLFREASRLRGIGYEQEEIEALLCAVNENRCNPPLEDEEIITIAESACRYEAGDILSNSTAELQAKNLPLPIISVREMRQKTYEPLEDIIFGVSRGEVGVFNAVTDAGKTTCFRNLSISAACGRPYLNLVSGGQPIRVLHLDLETQEARAASDIRQMEDEFGLSESEKTLVDENYRVVCLDLLGDNYDGDDAPLLSTKWVMELYERGIIDGEFDLLIIDTLSQAFDLKSENDNAEISRVVHRPLKKLARKCNTAILLSHHVGKGGEGSTGVSAYKGRGGSSLGGNAPAVYLMETGEKMADGSKTVTLDFSKVKRFDKPEKTELVLESGSRVFKMSNRKPEPKQTGAEKLAAIVRDAGGKLLKSEAHKIAASKYDVTLRSSTEWGKSAVMTKHLFDNGKNYTIEEIPF